MRRSTGEKIIILADVIWAFAGLAVFLCVAALLWIVDLIYKDVILAPAIFAAAVCAVSAIVLYITSLLLRGYGELVDNTERMRKKADLIADVMLNQIRESKE